MVQYEIRHSGYEKKLIAGIVITGGGANLRHITQLMEYHTGMDTRIGYPNEHLAKGPEELKSPMYATGIGLVMKGFDNLGKQKRESKIEQDKQHEDRKKTIGKVAQPTRREGTFFQK